MLQVHTEGRAAVSAAPVSRWSTTCSASTRTGYGRLCNETTERWQPLARVSRRAKGPRLQLQNDEVLLITRLLDELSGLLGDDGDSGDGADVVAEAADVLAGLGSPDAEPVDAPTDPALRRLLPDAYREDPEAAAEFRRYTEATLREEMAADLSVVRLTLLTISEQARAGRPGHASLDDDATQAWLRVLNRVRLVLAVRLGIETADDHDALGHLDEEDPRAGPFLLFEWLGYVLSDLLRAAF